MHSESELWIQIDSNVDAHRAEWGLVAEAESGGVRKLTEMDIRQRWKYITSIVKKSGAQTLNGNDAQGVRYSKLPIVIA